MLHGFITQDSDERKVIEKITNFRYKHNGMPDLTLFYNLLFDPVGYEGMEEYHGFYIGTNILRKEIGIEREGRPGDYDIIFIPYHKDKLFYERTAVFEVKIARPSFENVNRNANSLGENQVYGLIADGFPLVGLLHIVISRPLSLNQTTQIKMGKVPLNIDWQPGDPPQPKVQDLFESQPLDWLPWHGLDQQMTRLICAGFPKYVGINAFAITQNPDGTHNVTSSREYNGYTSGYFSPKKSMQTIAKIEEHFLRYGAERYRQAAMWDH
ncbi:hypothetical protein [Mucilaginibacter sp. dw_454]|uniref:hypothetical protein n=1 Tax=Mucilaginibacter sp. dw_454 TaxID=2720079 RepID=UPI001BD6DC06|nr:hypothetical protein [Mucilaginibacter sp. dw_454]